MNAIIDLKLPKPKIIVVDLDHTIHCVIDFYYAALNDVIKFFGQAEWNKQDFEKFYMQECYKSNIRNMERIFRTDDKKFLNQALNLYYDCFHGRKIGKENLLKDAYEMIYNVRFKLKLPLIAVTNTEQHLAKKILKDLGIIDLFMSVTGMKIDRHEKPSSHLLEIGLKKIHKISNRNIWMIGDDYNDVACAKAAAATGFLYLNNKDYIDETILPKQFQIKTHLEFLDLIKKNL